ncbi:AbrB family transcriptional regulator [Kaistia dalseonensis]|uniref:Membrane AbrB-like protein n=1 Tax=Kaistia dalseonensis TaxID=410840 RepID=A0ABU0H7I9_9HYPH|nr:AbrB family transcriptional regulator [Kaistia dalseonensis]MCX5495682.1 AbrB family transcriptional regulator [Kaistia dalseonensis]MDQ0438278.1 membrane AbrB-like protein [Kaistia dalseonensis]
MPFLDLEAMHLPSFRSFNVGLMSPAGQWPLLIGLSLALGAILLTSGVPAALLLGPMIAAIALGVSGATIRVPRGLAFGAQAVVSMLIAQSITPRTVAAFLSDWPLFLGIVIATIVASSALGWAMSRRRLLPGTTAVWGTSPGAASAMVLMAEAFGADARLVALMQYMRVVMVATAASLIASIWVDTSGVPRPVVIWFPPLDWLPLIETMAVAGIGTVVGYYSRIPSGAMLVPMVAGAVLNSGGWITITLPEWVLSASYALIGWRIGLGFTSAVLHHAARVLPHIVASILLLIAFCGCMAFVLVRLLGVDPLTAYLATSPGGMDSVAIIAAATPVDIGFVMALQTVRFFVIVLVGPSVAHFVARRMQGMVR